MFDTILKGFFRRGTVNYDPVHGKCVRIDTRRSLPDPFKLRNIPIAIFNQKKGCSKTTTAINLSCSLARKFNRVLLVDLDPQAHASLGLGLDVDTLGKTIYNVLTENVPFEDIIHKTSIDNLDIAPANSYLSGAQVELDHVSVRETALSKGLRALKAMKEYDYILFDCSPSLNLINLNALVAAEFLLIPTQTHYYSLGGMRELFATIDTVKESLNPELDIIGILPTLFDSRRKINHQMLRQLRDYFKEKVFDVVVHDDVKVYESSMMRSPVQTYAPFSRGAREYEELALELICRIESRKNCLGKTDDVEFIPEGVGIAG
jgi:chromosome partitioning protein